jgi:hypothetical protein
VIINDGEAARVFDPESPMDVAIFNFAYRLYLDGNYAANEKEKDRVVRKFIAYFEQRSTKEKFFLVCDLFDRLHAIDLANTGLRQEAEECGKHDVEPAPDEEALTWGLGNHANTVGWNVEWSYLATDHDGTKSYQADFTRKPDEDVAL